jgi:transcriptional regulator with XRE-family HTH domain
MARRVVPTAFPANPQLQTCEELGAAIRAARTARRLSLEDAALAINIAKQTLGDLEAGKPTVGLGIALRVAKGLGVSLFMAPAGEANVISRLIVQGRE